MEEACFDAVKHLMESGKYEHAMVRLQPHATESAGSVQAWWLAAQCLAHLEQYREVVKFCDWISACDPDHRDAVLLKGVAQFEGGLFAEALQTARSAMPHVEELSFNEQWPWLGLLGAAEYRTGAYVEAAETLDSSLQSGSISTMIMMMLKPSSLAPAEWYEMSDNPPCVLYALYALYRWPPGEFCEATDAFREISEFGTPDEQQVVRAETHDIYFYDEVLSDKAVRRIVLPHYLEAFRAKCHADEFYREILAYRAKVLRALEHEDADAYCEEVRRLDPKLLEDE